MLDGENVIIQNAVDGEASAFGLLYDHYQPQIYRFVILRVGQREEAEDLTHQIFLNAWANIGGYKHIGHPFSSWLYQIARNEVIDHYRTKKPTISLSEIDPETIPSFEMADLAVEHKLAVEGVMRGLRKLKPDYQDIIIMRFIEELSPKEVATILGKSEGAVKVIQHRAINQLRKILEA